MEFELFFNDRRKRSWGRWHINTGEDDWFETKKEAQKQIDEIQSGLRLQELLKDRVIEIKKEIKSLKEQEKSNLEHGTEPISIRLMLKRSIEELEYLQSLVEESEKHA